MLINTLWRTIGHIKILLSGPTDNVILYWILYIHLLPVLPSEKKVRVTSANGISKIMTAFFSPSLFSPEHGRPGIKDRFAAGGWISAAATIAIVFCVREYGCI
jgi:hypothetical protein